MAGLTHQVVKADLWDAAESALSGPRSAAKRPTLARINGAAHSTPAARSNGVRNYRAGLVETIELEIIPRLVLAHRATPSGVASPCWVLGPEHVSELAELVLAGDLATAAGQIEAICARGATVETVYLELLAPAARHLGELWKADLCRFTDVTLGLVRLQQVLRELGPAFRAEAVPGEHGHRALLVPAPGEQHTFGLFMVVEFFRRAGWDVWSEPRVSSAELVRLVREASFDVVGLSVSCDPRLDSLVSAIRAIRKASRNRAIGVLVGGPAFVAHPELVALVGADATAIDGRQAALQAQGLLALLARGC